MFFQSYLFNKIIGFKTPSNNNIFWSFDPKKRKIWERDLIK